MLGKWYCNRRSSYILFIFLSHMFLLTNGQICPPNQFQIKENLCTPPPSEYGIPDGLMYRCNDGALGSYGVRRIESSCEQYTFSSVYGGSTKPCGMFSSATMTEGISSVTGTSGNAGWCVSCTVPGNCPGAWSILNLSETQTITGIVVAGRTGPRNYVTSLTIQYSTDNITWIDVDNNKVFNTGLSGTNCFDEALMNKPIAVLKFSTPVDAKYIKVIPLTRGGCYTSENTYGAYTGWFMCMTFEALGISELRSPLILSYPFSNVNDYTKNWGIAPNMNLSSSNGGVWSNVYWNSGIKMLPGEYSSSNGFVDLSNFNEFTFSFWMNYITYSCSEPILSLLREDDSVYFGITPCYGTSLCKVTLAGTNMNGFGWGQNTQKKNLIVLHGRKAGNRNYFYVGQRNAGVLLASNGMSAYYEFFNVEWPSKLRIRIGTPNHKHVIYINDIRLYRDGASIGNYAYESVPSNNFPYDQEYCATCNPGTHCSNKTVFTCPANSWSARGSNNLSQCICNAGYIRNQNNNTCRLCTTGFYCPNETSEIPCRTSCPGFTYKSVNCISSADIVCTQCPSSFVANTPTECICPENFYNNGTGCSRCINEAISPTKSYGIRSCYCIPPRTSVFQVNPTTNETTLNCDVCTAFSYAVPGTDACLIGPNQSKLESDGITYTCPNGTWLPSKVPTNYSSFDKTAKRAGVLYWDFEDKTMINQWGEDSTTNALQARLYPDETTSDISTQNATCKFGKKCALICGTNADRRATRFYITNMKMPTEGLSVSFWIRINSCSDCSFGGSVNNQNMWNFAGVQAKHNPSAWRLALTFTYNGVGTSGFVTQGMFSGLDYNEQFDGYKNTWHHHFMYFESTGHFTFYHDGNLVFDRQYFNAPFPSVFSGSFFDPCYFHTLVDDLSIFKGDMRPYLTTLRAKPAYLVFNEKIALHDTCLPCPGRGVYCTNNTYIECPLGKNSTGNASTIQQCYCNITGSMANATDNCSLSNCSANWYCGGSGQAPQQCQKNTLSFEGSALVSQCRCEQPFAWNSSKNCTCPAVISKQIGNEPCSCGNGFVGTVALQTPIVNVSNEIDLTYKCGTLQGDVNCTAYLVNGYNTEEFARAYGDIYGMINLFDRDHCSPAGIQGNPGRVMIDLGDHYFITKIGYSPLYCSYRQDSIVNEFRNLSIYVSNDKQDWTMVYWIPSTWNYFPLSSFTMIPESSLKIFARYVMFIHYQHPSWAQYWWHSEILVKGLKINSTCKICPSGYYCPTNDESNRQICPPGSYCPMGSSQPILCDIGYYSTGYGNSVCQTCPNIYSNTLTKGSTSYSDCICTGGKFGRSDPNHNTPDYNSVRRNPASISMWHGNHRVVNSNMLWILPTDESYTPVRLPFEVGKIACGETPAWVQYDMGDVYAIGKIYVRSDLYDGVVGICDFSIKISVDGKFLGEEKTVVNCQNFSSCQPFDLMKWWVFPLVNGRYVRLSMTTWGKLSSGVVVADPYLRTNFRYMHVYTCTGITCSPCMVCPANSIQYKTWCACVQGYYWVNGACIKCIAGYSSLLDSRDISDCFPTGYFNNSIEVKKNTAVSVKGGNVNTNVQGNVNKLYDGTEDNSVVEAEGQSYTNYVWGGIGFGCTSGTRENPKTRGTVRFGYDMGSLGYLHSVYARSMTGWGGCLYAFRASKTGEFTGEETTIYECGWCVDCYCNSAIVGNYSGHLVELNPPLLTRYVYWWLGAQSNGWWADYRISQFRVNFQPLTKCPPNYYCTRYNVTACPGNNVTNGTEGGVSVLDCTCPPNAIWNNSMSGCQCNPGYYNVSNQCVQCSVGRTTNQGSSSESDCICKEGFYENNLQCISCASGRTSLRGSKSAQECFCKPGMFSSNSTTNLVCSTCAQNFYCPVNSNAQIPCPPGTMTNGTGQSVCNVICPVGYACPGDGTSTKCASGYFADFAGSTKCTPCPEGYYCPFNLSTAIACPSLYFCPVASVNRTACAAGLYSCPISSSCTIPCPPGGYCPGNGTIIKCPVGTYSKGGASKNCSICEPGFFCDTTVQLSAAGCA